MYKVYEPKTKSDRMTVQVNLKTTKLPNKRMFETQLKCKSAVFDDRRKRKPKYKESFEEI